MSTRALDKALGLVGLGARARKVVVGVGQVRAAALRGKISLALVATDVSRHSVAKVVPLLAAKGVEVLRVGSAVQLGAAVGRGPAAAVGVADEHLANGIRAALGGAQAV